ncbi:hypothetical protein OH492_21730 [Vibrio chagasii]|nr:hypothetical protein [Vibrio chagasii]
METGSRSRSSKGAAESVDVAALSGDQKALRRDVHKTISKVTDDIGRRQTFNTAMRSLRSWNTDEQTGESPYKSQHKIIAIVTKH